MNSKIMNMMNNWFNNIRIYHLLIDRFNGGWQVPPKSENAFCGGKQSRPFSFLYGTEQLMTNNPTIFNAEPYADLRVRNCMDWNLHTTLVQTPIPLT